MSELHKPPQSPRSSLTWKERLSTLSFGPNTANQKMLRAGLVIAVVSLTAKSLALFKELLIARTFGTHDAVDALIIALVVPTFLINLLIGSLNASLIPTYVQVQHEEGKQAAGQLLGAVSVAVVLLLGCACVLLGCTATHYLPLLASGFSGAKLMLAQHLLYILLVYAFFTGLATLWTAALNAEEQFAVPALTASLPPALVCAALLIGKTHTIYAVAIGLSIGTAAQVIWLGYKLCRSGIAVWPTPRVLRTPFMARYLRQLVTEYVPATAGALLMTCTTLVDQAMAAMLPAGNVAVLAYANRIVEMTTSVGALAVSTAVLPYFSQFMAKQNIAACRRSLRDASRLIAGASLVLTVLAVLCSKPIVRILYQHGSFVSRDTIRVAHVQAILLLQIPFYLVGILLVRILSSLRANRVIMIVAAINLPVDIGLNWLFMKYMGLAGIALSTSCMYALSFACLWIAVSIVLARREAAAFQHRSAAVIG